ncbi:SRPBCC domain-containing protein [Cucumibacter marinus]|uniref:SRPBCC domain-containing protein n=1 Tax=Cucumibacter marinus TaxID=1121252 RepID=UPI0003FD44BE|nr:SRPBCC domain-containing protein [Cucumibacter marinus]
MTDRSVVHATFTLKRDYPAPRARVFAAFADPEKKRQWAYGAPEGGHALDFRVGGRETVNMPGPGGGTFTYEGVYQDIIEGERIVYTYTIDFGGGSAAVTMATVELADSKDGGTHLKFTEQGAYLDGFDGPKFWESGTTSLLDRLGQSLAD